MTYLMFTVLFMALLFIAASIVAAFCLKRVDRVPNFPGIIVPKAENPHEISGPRKFSLLAIKMQRNHGWRWHEIALDWIYAWFFVPVIVLFGYYRSGGPVSNFMIQGLHRVGNPYNWWSLAPNWCAEWSARKAWGKNFKRNGSLATTIQCLFFALAMAVGASLQAQTNSLPSQMPPAPPLAIPGISWDFMTNIPSADNIASAKAALNIGIVDGGGLENEIKGDFFYKTNWMFSAAIQNATVASVIDKLSVHVGYRIAAPNYELYAQLMGRRNWTTTASGVKPSYQGGLAFGSCWLPMTSNKTYVWIEGRFLDDPSASFWSHSPLLEGVAGFTRMF